VGEAGESATRGALCSPLKPRQALNPLQERLRLAAQADLLAGSAVVRGVAGRSSRAAGASTLGRHALVQFARPAALRSLAIKRPGCCSVMRLWLLHHYCHHTGWHSRSFYQGQGVQTDSLHIHPRRAANKGGGNLAFSSSFPKERDATSQEMGLRPFL
jgi:hypothetical protein